MDICLKLAQELNIRKEQADAAVKLIDDGYKEILNSSKKSIYENNKYQIIIIEEFDYLIVVMVKL